MTTLLPYRVRAYNAHTESENRIHSDEVARQYGFRGGLVPGVTVYAYMTRPAVDRFGPGWLEHGTMQARFLAPAYDGEEVIVEAEETPDGTGPVLALTARGPDGSVRATGRAGLPAAAPSPPSIDGYPVAPLPAERPAASADNLAAGTVLGSIEATFHAEHAPAFLEQICDALALYGGGAVAHPGWVILTANTILVANVQLGPWVHVETETTHFSSVHDGDRVSTRGKVTDQFERKGHQFVELDLLMVANDEVPVQHVRHVAIWQLATRA